MLPVKREGPESRKKLQKIPRLLLAAPESGSGKTVLTCGILALLQRRGISCVSYKCGPDYIDPMFHHQVLGIPGYNLDSFFIPQQQVRRLFTQTARKADMALIEGVMGYYDGVAGTTTQASAYEIAQITDTPVILVVDGKKSSLSIAALVKGFLTYKTDSRIKGVILNRTSPMMAQRLRPCLNELGIRLYGAVPVCGEAEWESRHLGLTLPGEQVQLRGKVEAFADRLESCLDIDGLLELAGHRHRPGRGLLFLLPGGSGGIGAGGLGAVFFQPPPRRPSALPGADRDLFGGRLSGGVCERPVGKYSHAGADPAGPGAGGQDPGGMRGLPVSA